MKQDELAIRRERLKEVEKMIYSVCKGKGWDATISSRDDENWRYANISISNYRDGSTVKGAFDITLNDGLRIVPDLTRDFNSMINTHGWEELVREIRVQMEKIPWLKTEAQLTKGTQSGKKNIVSFLEEVLKRFHKVVIQIGRRHGGRKSFKVKDEYDAQDLLHALLKALFDDVRAEEVVPDRRG